MFGIGQMELLILGAIGILLFGNRLPKVMRDLGSGISEFKRGMHESERIKDDESLPKAKVG